MTPLLPPSPPAAPRRHLWAGSLALGVLVLAVLLGDLWCRHQERSHFAALLPMLSGGHEKETATAFEHLKNHGTVLQQRGLERLEVLPLYGSSELVKLVPDKASEFFRNYPTGFSVLPVGKAGATSLILLQKIAALRDFPKGRRVALSLSPSWFFTEAPPEQPYAGNFSRQQALSALLQPRFTAEFRRTFAQHLLPHPGTVERAPLVHLLATQWAREDGVSRVVAGLAWPLARLQRMIGTAQEHFEVLGLMQMHVHKLAHAPEIQPTSLDWEKLLDAASSLPETESELAAPPARRIRSKAENDALFRERLEHAPEWGEFELLLRGLHEMGLTMLVLSIPPDGKYLEQTGVSRSALDLYTTRVRALAEKWGAQVEAFEDHEEDDGFLADHHDHMSQKGWMYYNRALDEFYHADADKLAHAFAKGRRKPRHGPRSGGLPFGPTGRV